jgi:hypothetical protein
LKYIFEQIQTHQRISREGLTPLEKEKNVDNSLEHENNSVMINLDAIDMHENQITNFANLAK